MLVNTKEMYEMARKGNYAVAGFNTTSVTILRLVVEAAEEMNMPILISHAQLHEPYFPVEFMAPIMLRIAKEAKVPCAVHLDHGLTEDYIYKCIRAGFTSIMADFSGYPFEENVERTKRIVDMCHSLGITVEGEVGEMPSNIIGQGRCVPEGECIDSFFTDPTLARKFVEHTGVDSLAVSIGSVHGAYRDKPVVNFKRLSEIRALLPEFSLVVHGGSGLSDEDTRGVINNGVRKINIHTEVSTAPAKTLGDFLSRLNRPVYFHEICEYSRKVMFEEAKKAIALLKNN